MRGRFLLENSFYDIVGYFWCCCLGGTIIGYFTILQEGSGRMFLASVQFVLSFLLMDRLDKKYLPVAQPQDSSSAQPR